MIKVSKKILDSPKLKADRQTRHEDPADAQDLRAPRHQALPGRHLLHPGDAGARRRRVAVRSTALRDAACEEFFADYEQLRLEAQGQLRALHNPLDYPSLERVRRAFGMEAGYINIGVPQNLEGISKSIFDREKTKHARRSARQRTRSSRPCGPC